MANNARILQRIDKEIRDSVRNYQDAERAESEALEVEMARRRELREAGLDTLTSVTDSGFEVFNNGLQREIFELEAAEQFKLQVAGDNEVARQRIQENTARKRAELMRGRAATKRPAPCLTSPSTPPGRSLRRCLTFRLASSLARPGSQLELPWPTRPIPSYRRGRKSGPAELAYIGEEGAELVWDKKGDRAYLADSRQRATLPHDSAVLTAQGNERRYSRRARRFSPKHHYQARRRGRASGGPDPATSKRRK